MGKGVARRASQKKTRIKRCGFFYDCCESVRELRICLFPSGGAGGNDYVIKNVSLRKWKIPATLASLLSVAVSTRRSGWTGGS